MKIFNYALPPIMKWLPWSFMFLCFLIAYLISGTPLENKTISNYHEIMELLQAGKIEDYNYYLKLDEYGSTSIYKSRGNNYSGWFHYVKKGEDFLLIYEDAGIDSDTLNGTLFCSFSGYEQNSLLPPMDNYKYFLKWEQGLLVFNPINHDKNLKEKYEGLVMCLVLAGIFLPVFAFWITAATSSPK